MRVSRERVQRLSIYNRYYQDQVCCQGQGETKTTDIKTQFQYQDRKYVNVYITKT